MKKTILLIAALLIYMIAYAQSEIGFDPNRLINKSQNDSIVFFVSRYENIRTEDQFYQFYHDILIFKEKLSKSIHDSLVKNNEIRREQVSIFFNERIKFIQVLGNEVGDPFCLQMNNNLLKQKSKETIGENDNSFIDIIYTVYGEFGELTEYSVPFWIHKRSYVSISSKLGNNDNLNFYSRLKKEVEVNKIFKDELLFLVQKFKNDLTIYSAFDYKKSDVIKELKDIQKLDSSLKEEISIYINRIKSSSTFQFDCNKCECRFED